MFNSKIFRRGNLTRAKGQVKNEYETIKNKNFDERKFANVNDWVKNIVIDPIDADVNIFLSNSSKVEVHFYGKADVDGDINFNVHVENQELIISLEFIGNYYNGILKLDVALPHKTFKTIGVNSSSASVTLDKGVSTEYLKIETKSGNLENNATFSNASVKTTSGDIKFYINAITDINVDISTVIGDVVMEFNNIGHIDILAKTKIGNIENLHKKENGYTATVDISTMSGDIKIK